MLDAGQDVAQHLLNLVAFPRQRLELDVESLGSLVAVCPGHYDAFVGRAALGVRVGRTHDLSASVVVGRAVAHADTLATCMFAFAVFDSDLLRVHYPEIMRAGETPDTVLGFLSRAGDFLWLCGALAGRDGVEVIRFWSASQVHPTLPTRLAAEPGLAQTYAEALGLSSDDLVATLRAWHERVTGATI